MWNNHTKTQYPRQKWGTKSQGKLAKKLEMLIEELGLPISAITVGRIIQRNSLISTKANATSATILATANIAKRLCLLMNSQLGEVVLRGLLKLGEEIRDTKNGNEKCLQETESVCGVALQRYWKPTISSVGVHTLNCDTKRLMGVLSV